MAERLTFREALELVRDCSSQEWQQPDGKRMGATDNSGKRMWFIGDDVMQAVHEALKPRKSAIAELRSRSSEGADGVAEGLKR